MLDCLTERMPWFGVAVTRFTRPGKRDLVPFWVYLPSGHGSSPFTAQVKQTQFFSTLHEEFGAQR
jgi:hypothetical protein